MTTTDRHDRTWPTPVVLGLTSVGDLTSLPDVHAVAAVDELDRWREARDLATVGVVVTPFAVDDLTDAESGGATFDVGELGAVQDGAWPPRRRR